MASTRLSPTSKAGYSLIELLVVLAIVGILSVVGVYTLGNRSGESVRAVVDELEGAVMDAQKYAAASGRDVAIVAWGNWDTSSAINPSMVMARGAVTTAQTFAGIQAVAKGMVQNPPIPPTTDLGKTVAVTFAPIRSRQYMNCQVDTAATDGWAVAMSATNDGKVNQDLMAVAPFNSATDSSFRDAFNNSNLFQGAALNQVVVSGSNKRFTSSFCIKVVGTSGGIAVPGGAMGVLVVQNNGASVYRFYNSGVKNGDGRWRRI